MFHCHNNLYHGIEEVNKSIIYNSLRGNIIIIVHLFIKGWHAITNSMEQSPCSEANSRSASQTIPRLLWNQNVNFVRYEFAKGSYPEPDEPNPPLPTLFI
jgi:hypothetical protein